MWFKNTVKALTLIHAALGSLHVRAESLDKLNFTLKQIHKTQQRQNAILNSIAKSLYVALPDDKKQEKK